MQPRPYQRECLVAILDAFARRNSVLAVLATGLGKTVIFSLLAREWGVRRPNDRVLILAHREELINQAASKVYEITGEEPAIEMGNEHSKEDGFLPRRVVVSSVQTLYRPKRHRKFRPDQFGLLVIDEAHHGPARTYQVVIDYFQQNPECKLLGVTATPKRSDNIAMGRIFQEVVYEYSITPAVDDGWLVPVRQRMVVINSLDFSKIKTVRGDFKEGELEEVVTEEQVLHSMAFPAVEIAEDKPAIVFTVGVKQAQLMTMVLRRYKSDCAEWICGDEKLISKQKRRDLIQRYKSGDLQFLVNCGVLLEGFDAPATALVVMARPTKALGLYIQMLGRGTRPLPGTVDGIDTIEGRRAAIAQSKKPFVTVLDFVGNARNHAKNATVSAVDVLGGRWDDPVRSYAKKTMQEEGCAARIEEAMERASAELALLAEMEERRKRILADVQYRVEDVSGGEIGEKRSSLLGWFHEPATSAQVWKLRQLGMAYILAKSLTKGQARKEIDKLLKKQRETG